MYKITDFYLTPSPKNCYPPSPFPFDFIYWNLIAELAQKLSWEYFLLAFTFVYTIMRIRLNPDLDKPGVQEMEDG